MLGFIIIRHVTSKVTDYYWKECYSCIRKFYDNPIMIVDDSSDRKYLTENIILTNCTVIYDTDKKAAELLPYYYFHLLKPFDTAVILHDSVFIQTAIDFESESDAKFLWTFVKTFDHDIFHLMNELMCDLPQYAELIDLYYQKDKWTGCFGVMSVITWDLVHKLDQYHIFSMIPKLKTRDHRSALERVFALLVHHSKGKVDTFFGDIHSYIRWGTSFHDYLQGLPNPVVKVWTGR